MRVGPALAADQQEGVRAWLARLAKLFALGRTDSQDDRPIEELILGGRRRYTWAELIAETHMDPQLAARLWRSMGFAKIDEDEVAFTDADRDALRRVDQVRASGHLPTDIEVAATRALGQAMGALADWQVEVLHQIVPVNETEIDEDQIQNAVDQLLPLLETMQNYIWRRHLATAAGRLMTESPDGPHTRTLVVGFADMVEFTRTTRELLPFELLELVDEFQAVATDLVATHHGRVVKTVGDEVLFITEQPAAAAEIALGFIEHVDEIESLPQLRIGMALGPVLTRFGDVYGEVVNIASRLTTHAKPGRILIDANLAEALEDDGAYRVRPRRTLNVRGYSRLRSWGLTANGQARS
jgi:adenylate cyclase